MHCSRLSSKPPLTHSGIFQCGSMYSVSGFDVTQSNLNLKLFDSPILIQFDDETVFKDLTDPVSPIPQERFRFRNLIAITMSCFV
ncbi:unnamed protein product [Brassica rapa subsp. narinosa]